MQSFHHVTAPILYRDVHLTCEDFGPIAAGLEEDAPPAGSEEDKLKRKLHKAELLQLLENPHFNAGTLSSEVFNHLVRIHLPPTSTLGQYSEVEQKPAKRARMETEPETADVYSGEAAVLTRCVDVSQDEEEPTIRMYGDGDKLFGPAYIKINTIHGASGQSSDGDCRHLLPGCANRVYLRDRRDIEKTVESNNNGWARGDVFGPLQHVPSRMARAGLS